VTELATPPPTQVYAAFNHSYRSLGDSVSPDPAIPYLTPLRRQAAAIMSALNTVRTLRPSRSRRTETRSLSFMSSKSAT